MTSIVPESTTCGKSMKLSKCQPILNHPSKPFLHRYGVTKQPGKESKLVFITVVVKLLSS